MCPTVKETLQETPPYRALPEEDRRQLAEDTEVKVYAAGDEIFAEADPSDYLFTIASGRVKVFKATSSGKSIILGIFGSGDPLGSVAAYRAIPYPASACALEETVCLRIPTQVLFRLLEERPSVARGLLLGLTQRVVQLVGRVEELTGGRVEPRLARLFLRLGSELGKQERGGLFVPLALSRQDLADLVGTTIETCIRVMSRWERESTVHTADDGFVLLDRSTLESLAKS